MANEFRSTENYQSEDDAQYRTINYYDYDAVPRAKFFDETLFIDTHKGVSKDTARNIADNVRRRRYITRVFCGALAVAAIITVIVVTYVQIKGGL
jgi:hypothetical protein